VARGEKEILEAAKEIRKRAVRGIGQAMEAQREAGLMSKGAAAPGNANWQRQRGSESDPRCENERDEPKTITLAEAGIDKHLADKARKFAARGGPAGRNQRGLKEYRGLPLCGTAVRYYAQLLTFVIN
jgi:hypothetical protein